MLPEILEEINQKIYTQFPYLHAVLPDVTPMEKEKFLLVYKGLGQTDSGFSLPLVIRVVVNNEGDIIKISSSR